MVKKYKLAILAPNLTPNLPFFYKKISADPDIDLMVYLCSDYGITPTKNPLFGNSVIQWEKNILEGYHYKILANLGKGPASAGFWGLINLGILSELIREKYNALIIYGYSRFTSWFALLAGLITRTPVFYQGESSMKQESKRSYFKRILKKLLLNGFFFRNIDAVLFIGQENRKFYEYYSIPSFKLFFTPYAVENDYFIKIAERLKPKRHKLRVEHGYKPNDIIISFCGKMYEAKRPMDLLRAYHKLINDLPPKFSEKISLLFVGDGILRQELEEYAKKHNLGRVKFVGFQSRSKMPEFYILSDIFVLCSSSETWGMVVNEAMCFGLPVIVSDAVGCGPDLVEDNKNGFIFPVGNFEKLATFLKILCLNKDKREEFGEKSRNIIVNYSYDKYIFGIKRALNSLK